MHKFHCSRCLAAFLWERKCFGVIEAVTCFDPFILSCVFQSISWVSSLNRDHLLQHFCWDIEVFPKQSRDRKASLCPVSGPPPNTACLEWWMLNWWLIRQIFAQPAGHDHMTSGTMSDFTAVPWCLSMQDSKSQNQNLKLDSEVNEEPATELATVWREYLEDLVTACAHSEEVLFI